MNKLHLLFIILSICCLVACNNLSTHQDNARYIKDLVEAKKITFPIDENTYYLSKSMFQFEEEGKEYLYFGNLEKKQHEIQIYDIEKQELYRRIPLEKEGSNGVPAISGIKPFGDSNVFIAFQNNVGLISLINGKGIVLKRYAIRTNNGSFVYCGDGFSYFHNPSFCVDSIIYFVHSLEKPSMRKEEWKDLTMFTSLNLRNGQLEWSPIHYPSIFDRNIKNPAGGYRFTYDYNYNQNTLVCSFTGYDSLMVTSNLKQIRWYNGKSKYLKNMRPKLEEAAEGIQALVKLTEKPQYHNIIYDKYRDVYYRFVELPYELSNNESPFGDPTGREFSIIIFDKDLNIIGETKFPGNKYLYKMSFVGKDGLYISENNLANPDFDEDKLVFACFQLVDASAK